MRHCRVVFDTNVLMSALGWGGTPGAIFESFVKGEFILVLSPPILDELKSILSRPKFDFISDTEKGDFFTLLTEMSEMTFPQVKLNAISADPSDNRILECALSARADFIISGDKHLLALKSFGGIQIVTPGEFATINKI